MSEGPQPIESADRLGPVALRGRIEGLDVLRGLAIFGILVVNIPQMFLPFDYAEDPVSGLLGESAWLPTWFVVDAFFESKFITLFSLLFGAGLCLQWLRAEDRGTPFLGLYLRRLGLLLAFGLIHGTFFYFADVLVIYTFTALLMLPFRRLSGRRLVQVGSVLVVLMLGWSSFISGPSSPEEAAGHSDAVSAIAEARATGQLRLEGGVWPAPRGLALEHDALEHLPDGKIRLRPADWRLPLPADVAILVLNGDDAVERAKTQWAVLREGPARPAIFTRVSGMAFILLLVTPIYLLWKTLGLFLIGGGLLKGGFLEASKRRLWQRVATFGLAVGVPLTLVASVLRAARYGEATSSPYLSTLLHDGASLLLAAGLGSAVLLWTGNEATTRLHKALAAVGRTALSNYLGQSIVMSLVATHYGLGLYGDLGRAQLLGLAVVCFVGQILVSQWWLSRFAMGPLEWLWRCCTYWRVLPLRRADVLAERRRLAA